MKNLTISEKQAIQISLIAFVKKYPSQNKAVNALKGVSAGTVSSICNEKWENISDDMWRNIAAQVQNTSTAGEWTIVNTTVFNEVHQMLEDAQLYCSANWVTGEAGCGKTTSALAYCETHKEAFYILCSEDMKRGDFVREIARVIGLKVEGSNLAHIWADIFDTVVCMDSPLLIFDEADKLSENVFHYFISMYNRLEDYCGLAFLSTDYICRRMRYGLQYNKKGYQELYSRIGRKFIPVCANTELDIQNICVANGISGQKIVSEILNKAKACALDIRRVKKLIHIQKRKGMI